MSAVIMTYVAALGSVALTLALVWSHRSELRRLFGFPSPSPDVGVSPRASEDVVPPTVYESMHVDGESKPTETQVVRSAYMATVLRDVESVIESLVRLRRDIGRTSLMGPSAAEMRLRLEEQAELMISQARRLEVESKKLANEDT